MACCNTTLCYYRRKKTCAPSMFLQRGKFGVLLHLIEGDLYTFIVVMWCCVEGDCWTNNNPPCHTNNPPRRRRLMCLVDTCTYNHPTFPTSTQQTKGKIFFVILWFFTSWKHSSCGVCDTHIINKKKGSKVNETTCGDTMERPKWVLKTLKNVRIGGQQRE